MFIYAVNFRDLVGLHLSKIAIKIQFYYCEGVWWRKCCGRRVEMISGSTYHPSDNQGQDAEQGDGPPQARNPLLCFLCDDYYSEPCLLGCYHTFCARCLRGRELDSKIACPLCGQQTMLRDGTTLPPADLLMRQLIDLANSENPPCANCDKRDKTSMYFCSTCGQALCNHCRENTHRAKMFSTHEVIHMSKCSKEGHRRCGLHGEQYIMFSNSQKNMLCVNCFRDTPAEARLHCVDIDTAHTQCTRKLEKAIVSVCDLQNSVREGLLMFKNLLEELHHNMDTEKHTINSFCQGMQEAIAKTHSNMIMEVQRQFETKERQFRSQLMSLSTVLPLLQLHILLCSSFSSSANKYQFLDLAYPMMDRLAAVSQLSHPLRPVQSSQIRTNYRNEFSHSLEPWVGKSSTSSQQQPAQSILADIGPSSGGTYDSTQHQSSNQQSTSGHVHAPPSKRQHTALRAKALEGEGPFSNHCRSFDSQIKELSQQLSGVKEHLSELHRDVTLLRRANSPPLSTRYEHITRECALLEEQLEGHQVELERLKNVFDTLWEEQLCRIHVEQDIFQSQMNDILTLRSEVKNLSVIANQLEPYVKSLTSGSAPVERICESAETSSQETSHQQLQSLLEHISALQMDTATAYRMDASQKECRMHPSNIVSSPTTESAMYMKVDGKDIPVREGPRVRGTREQMSTILDASGNLIYTNRQQQASQSLQCGELIRDSKRGVLSQLIEKVRTKEDRKKSPIQEEPRLVPGRERSKSDGRGSAGSSELCRAKMITSQQSDDLKQCSNVKTGTFRSGKGDSSTARYVSSTPRENSSSKVASLYHTISGKVLGSREIEKSDTSSCGIELNSQSSVPTSQSYHNIPPPPPPTGSRRPQSHLEDIVTSSELMSNVGCMDVRERLESHLKEKLHDIMGRSSLLGRIARPLSSNEKGDERNIDESEYQRISEPSDSPAGDRISGTKQAVRALIHQEPSTAVSTPTSPHRHREQAGKVVRHYPASDPEETVLFTSTERQEQGQREKIRKQNNSCESLTLSSVSVNSRRSSMDLGDRKTLVVVIGTSSKGAKARLMQKQRSWETFPPKKHDIATLGETYGKFCRETGSFGGGFDSRPQPSGGGQGTVGLRGEIGSLKKADSFEGHEEAVRTLVAAVQETRSQHMLQQQRKQSHTKPSSN